MQKKILYDFLILPYNIHASNVGKSYTLVHRFFNN